MKLAITAVAAFIAIPIIIGGVGHAIVKALFGGGNAAPTPEALADIPPNYLALYQAAAHVCPGLDWSILAAIGKIESDHGRSRLPGVHSGENSAGAGGPMQFLQPTFDGVIARHQPPSGGANPPSRYNPQDAIYAAAHNLCDNGVRRGDLRAAVFAYNHADWYVDNVIAQAAKYSQANPNTSAACQTVQSTASPVEEPFRTERALVAVAFACAQLGKPYMWGGNGNPGFDCSGLTHAAYAAARVQLPRTAQTQYNAGPLLPLGTSLLPGDLVFFGTPNRIHHVGIALGGALMVHAPTFGEPVQVADLRSFKDYAGASRPVAAGGV